MAKTSTVFTRVEPEVKAQAEQVLDQLGISMSSAVGMFLKQVALQKGIPFEIKLPKDTPDSYGALSEEAFNAVIEKGLEDYREGRVLSAEEVEERMSEKYGI